MNPEVSVVIAVYNGAKYISETLDSILNQTYTNWECIVVDDGSTDATCELVEKYIKKDNRFKIIKTSGGNGPYIAANIGIKEAQGEYIARSDADDISLPQRIQLQYSLLLKNKKINLCGTLHYALFENGKTTFKSYDTDPFFLKWQLLFQNRLVHSTMMMRKKWIESIGYYPEKPLAQDWHIWLQASNSDSLYIINRPLVKWRIHSSSITKMSNKLQLLEASKVSLLNLKTHEGISDLNELAITKIISAIRGNILISDISTEHTIGEITRVYENFKFKYKGNSKIKSHLHLIIHSIFSQNSTRSIKSYLKTSMIDGISFRWFKGLIRQIFS